MVDGNVDRVLARYLALDAPVRAAKDVIRTTVQQAVPERAGDFAQALMDLGGHHLHPEGGALHALPAAARLPRHPQRRAAGLSRQGRKARAPHPATATPSFIRDANGDVFLQKRAATGLLAQMTETPTSAWLAERAEPAFPFRRRMAPCG